MSQYMETAFGSSDIWTDAKPDGSYTTTAKRRGLGAGTFVFTATARNPERARLDHYAAKCRCAGIETVSWLESKPVGPPPDWIIESLRLLEIPERDAVLLREIPLEQAIKSVQSTAELRELEVSGPSARGPGGHGA